MVCYRIKSYFLPDNLELIGPQFPPTTNSSPITSSMSPILWPYSIVPAPQLNRGAGLCVLLFLFEITFLITNDPLGTKETLFCIFGSWKVLLLGNEATSNCCLTSVCKRFSSLQWSNTCYLQPIPGRKDETRADCCVMTWFFSTLPRFSCSCPKNIGKWSGNFTLVSQTLSEELLSETELNLRMTLKFIKRTVISVKASNLNRMKLDGQGDAAL